MVTMYDLCQKDVISITTGANIGRVGDLSLSLETAQVSALTIYGRPKLFGLLGRYEDITLPWEEIVTIGDDVILTRSSALPTYPKRRPWFKWKE